ncbi:hypothetical protein [Bradyrhizobium liaoningense]|nr:hypothetical protein [Bradyrhizobium liaoningense]MBR0820000.1 hypothetical protein [Bradyrhizobium liaoningense]
MALFQIAAIGSNFKIHGTAQDPTLQRCSRLIELIDPRAEILQNETVF